MVIVYEQSGKLNACSASGAVTCHRINPASRATTPNSQLVKLATLVVVVTDTRSWLVCRVFANKGYKRLTLWVSCTRSRGYRKRRNGSSLCRGEISRYRVIVHDPWNRVPPRERERSVHQTRQHIALCVCTCMHPLFDPTSQDQMFRFKEPRLRTHRLISIYPVFKFLDAPPRQNLAQIFFF